MTSSTSQRPHIIVAATGNVASLKLGYICYTLLKWADVRVVVTEHAKPFIEKLALPYNVTSYTDASEFTVWKKPTDPVLHIELHKWADIMLIAPLSSNTLAKIASGICDNLLTSIVKVWDCHNKLLFIVPPAMDTLMFKNCLTKKHLQFMVEDMKAFNIPTLSCGNPDLGCIVDESCICSCILTAWERLNSKSGFSCSEESSS